MLRHIGALNRVKFLAVQFRRAMQVVSVNVGMPREVEWKGMRVATSIFKSPVEGAIAVRSLNLAGDRQADLTVHGGPEKAVYAYSVEHYADWRAELPDVDLPMGMFGENLTIEGLSEDTLHIGDQLRIGSVLLMAVQPRVPCYKLQLRFDRDDILKRFLLSGRSGFYFSVVEEGELRVGESIEVVRRDPGAISIGDINRLFLGRASPPDLLERALNVAALPASWHATLVERSQRGR